MVCHQFFKLKNNSFNYIFTSPYNVCKVLWSACLYVGLSVCLLVSTKPQNTLYMLPMAVAWSCSDVVQYIMSLWCHGWCHVFA